MSNRALAIPDVLIRLISEDLPIYRYDKIQQIFVRLTKDSPISQLYTGSAYSYYEDPVIKITPESALQKLLTSQGNSQSIVWQHEDTEDQSVYNPLVDLNILINPKVTFYYKAFITYETHKSS